MIYTIKNEREYIRAQNNRPEMIGVKENGISDPTAMEVIEMDCIERAIIHKDCVAELLDCLEPEERARIYKRIFVLRKMQEEYELFESTLLLLSRKDRSLFELYMENDQSIQRVADIEGILYESAVKKIWRLRKKIKERMLDDMTEDLKKGGWCG